MITRHILPALFLLFLFLSCKESRNKALPAAGANAGQLLQVETMILRPQTLSSDIEVPGTILANETTEIHPEVAGRIVELHILEGRNVTRNTLLAKLYDGDLQAEMRKLQIQLKIAEQTEQRQAELLKIQGISQQDYDLSLLQVQSLKADMDIVQEEIRKTEIRAPFNGKLGLKHVSPGAYVTPATALTTVSQVDQLKLQFNVPERYSSELRTGMEVQFQVDGSPQFFTARIMATAVQVEENTRSLAVRGVIKQKENVLIPGAFAKVGIVLGKNDKALLIPSGSILPSGRKKQVFVYEGGKAMMREITTGVRDSLNVQALTGLEEGDTLITSAILFLRPGMEVGIGEL